MERACSTAAHTGHTAESSRHPSEATAWHSAWTCAAGGRSFSPPTKQEVEAILVVDFSFFRVGKDLVGLGDFFEFFAGGGVVFVFVWVVF